MTASAAVPAFADDVVRELVDAEIPASDRATVLSHNDVNPSNLVHDGERLLLLDWDVAGPNDALYDLATIAMFLRMSDDDATRLLSAHDGVTATALPARFRHLRRMVAAMCGAMGLKNAVEGGHAGATGAETFDTTPALGDIYARMRTGALSLGTPDGVWSFGLALIRESVAT